ncbi:MAG TPA: hypothetical protein EYO79_04640 [Candidatus Marinimicrobia bacterium]|nr:hypothetical protein [Candidatus Neomarinimicrobiota bacterium]
MQYLYKQIILLITLIGIVSAQTIELYGKKLDIHKDEVILEVSGLVCSFCAVGLQGGLSSLKDVDKKKYIDGVFVNVEYQYAVIAEAADKDIDIDKAIELIVKSGYEVKTVFTNRTGEKIETRKIESKKDEK